MEVSDLRNRYVHRIPFVEVELTDNLISTSFEEAANYYSQYYPKITTRSVLATTQDYVFTENIPDMVLRVYYETLVFMPTVDNLCTDWEYNKPTLQIYAGGYWVVCGSYFTLEDITTDDLREHNLLDKLIRLEICIAAANKRRMAALTELPLDAKGDQFYSDSLDEKREIIAKIDELAPVTY